MRSQTISDLTDFTGAPTDAFIPIATSSQTMRLSFVDMANEIWEQMYVKARSVITFCEYCHSGNAITNGNCVQCGAPME